MRILNVTQQKLCPGVEEGDSHERKKVQRSTPNVQL